MVATDGELDPSQAQLWALCPHGLIKASIPGGKPTAHTAALSLPLSGG
jgi:hypothetical protein